jgi:hypothetical protein
MKKFARPLSTPLTLMAAALLALGPVVSQGASSPTTPTTVFVPLAQTESEAASTPELTDGQSGSNTAGANGPVLPVASNPITNTSTTPGLIIEEVLVENNVNPATGKDAADHLEIVLRNESDQEMTGFEVYYEITDLTTEAKEGYHSKLEGFTIPSGGERVVHFDDTGEPDHYPDNEFSLYHLSMNELQVDVTVSAAGFAPQTASVKKDAGGDENPDE